MARVDFKEVRQNVPIERAISKLGLVMTHSGEEYRGACPACNGESKRSLSISTKFNNFKCWRSDVSGDVIGLVAHIKTCTYREAAIFLTDTTEENAKPADKEQGGTFNADEYAKKLDKTHELVTQLGFTESDCEIVGMGVAAKGVHKDRFALPIRDKHGRTIVYLSITEGKLPAKWRGT